MMTPKQVKQDLRSLSKKSQSITTMLDMIELHKKCADCLKSKQIQNQIDAVLKELEKNINDFTSLEIQYMRLIERLEPTQKVVIIDHYINAEPLWKTANKFGYTDRHLCRYINDAILKIAQMSGYENRAGQ